MQPRSLHTEMPTLLIRISFVHLFAFFCALLNAFLFLLCAFAQVFPKFSAGLARSLIRFFVHSGFKLISLGQRRWRTKFDARQTVPKTLNLITPAHGDKHRLTSEVETNFCCIWRSSRSIVAILGAGPSIVY